MKDVPPKRPRARQNVVTPALAAELYRTQISDRRTAIVLIETAKNLGYNPLTLVIKRSTISRLRKTAKIKFIQNVQTEFHASKALAAHWDGVFWKT